MKFTISDLISVCRILFLSIAITFLAFAVFSKWRHSYWRRKNFPFLQPRLLFGNVQNPLTRNLSTAQEYKHFYDTIKSKSWKHAGVFSFLNPVYVPVNLEHIKAILTKDFNYFDERGRYYNEEVDPISAHLFNIGGAKWKELRAKFTPTLSSAKLKTMFGKVLHCGQVLESAIDPRKPFEIKQLAQNFTAEVIGLTVFGVQLNTFQDSECHFLQQTSKFLRGNLAEAARMVLTFSFPQLSKLLRVPRYDQQATRFFTKFVVDLVKYREENEVTQYDFLQTLIDLKNREDASGSGRISMDQLIAQAMIFLVAGYDSTANTIAMALYELSINIEMQDKVRDEIRNTINKGEGELTYEGVWELKYTQQVISETLRKHPPLAIINRQANSDYKIPGSDGVLEKGTPVIIPLLGLHYDEELFPNPDKFDPERFSQENIGAIKPYSYLPFGEGPKGCLGVRYALLNTKVALCALLKNYRYTLNTQTELPFKYQMGILNSVKGGIWFNVEKLNG